MEVLFFMATNKYAYRVTVSALCMACSVILCRFLGFSPEYMMVRFEIGILPIALAAHLYGPVYGGICYLGADIAGALIMGQAINPFISLCKCLIGILLGVFFYRHRLTFLRSSIAMTVIAIVCEFAIMTVIFVHNFGYPPITAVWMRILTAGLNLPLRIVLVYLLGKLMQSTRGRIFYEHFK